MLPSHHPIPLDWFLAMELCLALVCSCLSVFLSVLCLTDSVTQATPPPPLLPCLQLLFMQNQCSYKRTPPRHDNQAFIHTKACSQASHVSQACQPWKWKTVGCK